MKASDTIDQLATGLSAAQAEMKHAAKDSENPFFKSHYADLASVFNACRSLLAKNGLSVIQGAESTDPGIVMVTTRLAHKSGQWIESTLTVKPVKADPQGIGSAITYARRYALAAMVGVATEDDDGNGASHDKQQAKQIAPPVRRPVPQQAQVPTDDDNAEFTDRLDQVFKAAGFDVPDADKCIGYILKSKNRKTILDLDAKERAGFIAFIESGKADKFKVNGQPVGAA